MAKEILIADSDKAEQEKFQQYFEATDYHLIFSESGEDALLRVKLFKPDMIIAAGKGLHEMGGLELCGVLKRDPEYKHIPFIIISGIFDEISEKDLKRNQADGVISKPLNEEEVLNLVDHLMEGGTIGTGEEGREEVLLDEMGEGEEEIIELLDVIEEPEPKMSIDDFVTTEKEETLGDLAPLESWGKLEFEEKPSEKEVIEEIDLQLKREMPRKEAQPEEELFEKIELTEILEQVEQMKPSIEKEWPSEKEGRVFKEKPPQKEETVEKYLDLSEFETAFQDEVKTETGGLELESFPLEAPQKEISEEALLIEESVEEELKELTEEELPDEFLEEILREEEIRIIDETKEVKPEEVKPEEVEPEEVKPEEVALMEKLEEFEAPRVFEEEIKPLVSPMSRPVEELSPIVKMVDQHLEEVIAKGIQDMVGDFITKILPEMTQHIMGLTAERIEKMVREIVPDLAEKAIQEEIKRLQKGEKD